jgi:dihydroorotate dehydrogenase electron transfer subunit
VTVAAAETLAHPLAAPFYADIARQMRVTVVSNEPMARDTWRLRLECPELGRIILPGQFLMLRLPGRDDPLLGRPFALYDTWLDATGAVGGIDVGYLVVGRMTRRLPLVRSGDQLEAWGPLGNGFAATRCGHLIMVAGGIGQTPFLAVGREALGGRQYGEPRRQAAQSSKVTLCYGVRSADLAAGVDDFRQAGVDVCLSTDDGTAGRHGLVTHLLAELLDEIHGENCRVLCCGPDPMMEAVAELTTQRGVRCEVSLETPMACGIGICFSCVVKVRQPDGQWDYKRTCFEGPVFDANKIVWR